MSLRSNSPWTSMSSPTRSCQRIARSVSSRRKASYAAPSSSPRLNAARALRTSLVCGNEPTIVDDEGKLEIVGLKHPVVELALGSAFVPNDVHLAPQRRVDRTSVV